MDPDRTANFYKVVALLDRAYAIVEAVRAAQCRKYKKDREAVSDIMYLNYEEVTLLWSMGGFSSMHARVNDEVILWCADAEARKKQATATLALPAEVVYIAADSAKKLALLKMEAPSTLEKGHRLTFKVSKNFWRTMQEMKEAIERVVTPAKKVPGGESIRFPSDVSIRVKRSTSK